MANFRQIKVIDIRDSGTHLVCIKRVPNTSNLRIFNPFPYRVYKVSCGHRRQISKCASFCEAISDIYTWLLEGNQ